MGGTVQPPRPQTRPHYYSSRGNKYILRETDARTVGQEGPRHGKRNLVCEKSVYLPDGEQYGAASQVWVRLPGGLIGPPSGVLLVLSGRCPQMLKGAYS